jgi:hypothetical protein
LVSGEVPQLNGSLLHVVFEGVPLQTDVFGLSLTKAFWEYAMALWLSSQHMVIISVMGELKISPISCRGWSPSLVASAAE